MAMYTLPRPALEFGSDNLGFTDPLRYSSQKVAPPPTAWQDRSSSNGEPPRPIGRDLLPGVNQLLTPALHSSVSPGSYPSNQSLRRPPSLSLGQGSVANLSRLDVSHASLRNYQPSQPPAIPQFSPNTISQQDSYRESFPPSTDSYIPTNTPIQAAYPGYASPIHQVSFHPQGLPQPVPSAAYSPQLQQQQDPNPNGAQIPPQGFPRASPVQCYLDDSNAYSVHIKQIGSPETPDKSMDNPVKLQPRVVRETVIPGDGPVYVYEDGSTCPKVIDGEPVNAEWGVTKAGKPRKRLAIACTTCREKKIKCQPALPKCAQCDKFGRECHYATAPRLQQSSPETPSDEFQARHQPVMIKTEAHNRVLLPSTAKSAECEEHPLVKRRISSSENDTVRPVSHHIMAKRSKKPLAKKPRSCLPVVADPDECDMPTKKSTEKNITITTEGEDDVSKVPPFQYDWSKNPYESNARLTRHYMEMYIVHVNAAAHRLFPRNRLVCWLEESDAKSQDDLMLIYAMLALGSVFSVRHDRTTVGRLFAEIARYALEKCRHTYSLQLVQSRILLGLYHFAIGEPHIGWDLAGQGFRAALGLRLNTEEHCGDVKDAEDQVIGLQGYGLIECRRRTYWLAYVVDRLGAFQTGYPPMLQSQDVFLRLPCDGDTYCQQKASSAAFFKNGLNMVDIDQSEQAAMLDPMAYLVNILAIWGDVVTFNHRHARESAGEYVTNYERHYRETLRRLSDWKTRLPKDIEFNPSNTSSAIERGTIGMLLDMHALYHATTMTLGRNLRHGVISPLSSRRNFDKARKQALELLKTMEVIASASRPSKNTLDTSSNVPELLDEPFNFGLPLAGSSPFAGHAALLAIDILSAGGCLNSEKFKNLIQSMNASLTVINEVSQCWASGVAQKNIILSRLKSICSSATNDAVGEKKAWRCREALDAAIRRGQDVFYPHGEDPRDSFFDNLEVAVKEDEVLYID